MTALGKQAYPRIQWGHIVVPMANAEPNEVVTVTVEVPAAFQSTEYRVLCQAISSSVVAAPVNRTVNGFDIEVRNIRGSKFSANAAIGVHWVTLL